MNQLQTVTNQTPIEIALGIDEKGMTTAKKLYRFLELNKSNYSKWCKTNILENEFAEEGTDFHSYQSTSEGRGNFAQDFKLTATFAKKLSMAAKNERGEEARNYFIKAEDKLKEVASKKLSPLDELELHYQAMKQINSKVEQVDSRVDKLENTMVIDYGQQRVLAKLVNSTVVTALGGKDKLAYKEIGQKVFAECNRDIKDRFLVNSRNDIPKLKFGEACKYIKNWQPCTNTKMMINDCNAQMCMV